jgi:hypothetical protein
VLSLYAAVTREGDMGLGLVANAGTLPAFWVESKI